MDKVQGFALGAVDYITKPFQQEEVLTRITSHLALEGLKTRWLPALMLSTGAADAATLTLFTPPLVPDGYNVLDCHLVNVGRKTRAVTIQIFNREGQVLESVQTTLGPGQENVARAGADALPRYCKFVVEGSKANFRGSILVRQEGVGSISALPAE